MSASDREEDWGSWRPEASPPISIRSRSPTPAREIPPTPMEQMSSAEHWFSVLCERRWTFVHGGRLARNFACTTSGVSRGGGIRPPRPLPGVHILSLSLRSTAWRRTSSACCGSFTRHGGRFLHLWTVGQPVSFRKAKPGNL